MSLFTSGIPRNQSFTVDAAGRKVLFTHGLSERLVIVTDVALNMFLTQEDFDANVNGFPIPITGYANDIKARGVFFKSTAGTATVVMQVMQRS